MEGGLEIVGTVQTMLLALRDRTRVVRRLLSDFNRSSWPTLNQAWVVEISSNDSEEQRSMDRGCEGTEGGV